MSNYKIRKFRKEDETYILELLNDVFKPWPRHDLFVSSNEHWKWKHYDAPFGNSFIVVAECNEKVVGCAHTIFRKYKVGDYVLDEVFGADLAVHPDHRGKRLSSKMSEFKYSTEEIKKNHFSTSASNIARVVSRSKKQNRIRYPNNISYHTRILDPDIHFKNKKTIQSFFKNIGYRIFKKLTTKKYRTEEYNFNIKTINHFDSSWDRFWSEIKKDYSFILYRSREYLNWRYCDRRGGDYHVLLLEDDEMCHGYVVLRINRINKEYPEGYVVDIMSRKNEEIYYNALLDSAITFLDAVGVNDSYLWAQSGSTFSKLVKSFGFINTQQSPLIYYRAIRNEPLIHNLLRADSEKNHLQMGDTDWI